MLNFFMDSKIGLMIGTIIGLIFVIWSVFPQSGTLFLSYSSRSLFSIIFIDIPVVLSGAISGLIIEGLFIKQYILLSNTFRGYKTGSVIGCIIGGILFFPIGCFLGLIGGAVWGGALIGAAGEKIGLENKGIPIGFALGIAIVAIILTLIGAIIGSLIGLAFDSFIRRLMTLIQ